MRCTHPICHLYQALTDAYCSNRNTTIPKEARFSDLENLIKRQISVPQEQNEYMDALAKLETAFNFMHVANLPLEPGAAFVWPIMLQRESIHRFTEQPPLSLILLAHYCVILHRIDGYWFFSGWYKALLIEITEALPLELRSWVVWPKNICGLIELERDPQNYR